MWNIAHQFIMKLFIIFAICYVASGQVKRLHVGATLNRLEEPRQRRLLQEADEPQIITVPRPGEEFVFISAGNNQKRGRFLEESKKKHHQSVSLFQAPSSVETGFKGVDLSVNIAETELKSEPSEQIPIKSHSVSLFEAPETFDARFRGNNESVDIIKREAIQEDSSVTNGPISSRTVVKTSPNGKEYEYEYLYYYDDSEEESEEEYDDVGEKQKTTTTTTTESPPTRPKRVRGKTTTEPTSENTPKVSNSRGQLFVQQQSILNKSPITNLRDNSIARAIKPEPKIEKSFETSSEEINLDKDTFKKLSTNIENDPSELEEEEINMEIQDHSIKQNQATVQGINEEAVKVSLNREDVIHKTHQDSKTININLKDDQNIETQVPLLQREDKNDKKTEELNISNNDESRAELIGEAQHTAAEDAEIAHSAQAQGEKTHEGPRDIKPMIIHAEMMNEDEFKKKQEQEDTEPTIKPFDLENDIAKPTSSTPDEMSEAIPTEAPEFERILPGTRFPARIHAKIEMMTKSSGEIITEGSADQEIEQGSNGPEVLSSQNREMDDQNEEFKKEIDGIEREAPLSDDENLVETYTENQSTERDETLGNNLPSKEIENSEASDQDVNKIVAKAEKTILEAREEAIQSNRINDSRAIHNLLVISQALNDEKDESSEKEVKDDQQLSEATEKTRISEIRTSPSIKQTTSNSDVTEATTETTTTKTKRTRFGGIRTRAPFFSSRSTARQANIPQTEGEETSTTIRAPTTRFNRFGSRRKPTRTPTSTEIVSVVESRDDQSESMTQSVITEQTKQTRGRFRPSLFRGEQRRRKPISGDLESVTVPIAFEIKRQRPILPTRNLARVSPLSRRQKTTTTTEVIDLLAEMEATESPEESITLFELKDENEIIKTSTAPNEIQEEVQEEITLRPVRRRPSNTVGERSRKSNISPVAARRLSILGRRRTTTTTSPELSDEEEGSEIKIEDIQKEEAVEHESEHHHNPELEESEPEPVPETTTQATRLSILERNKLRRFRAKSTL